MGVGEGKAQCINICMRVGVFVRFVGIAGADTVGLVFEAHFSRSLEELGRDDEINGLLELNVSIHRSLILYGTEQLHCDF